MSVRAEPPVNVWSTRDVLPEQRLAFYSDLLSSLLDPMAVARTPDAPFDAQLTATALGPLTLIHGTSSAHACVRDATHLSKSTERKFHLILNRGSGWNLRHRDAIHLNRGDAVLLDSRLGHYFEFCQPFDIVHLVIPEDWLSRWLPDPAALAGRPISCDGSWGRALTSFVSQLSPDTIHQAPLPVDMILDHVGALFALYAGEMSGRQNPPALQHRQLRDQLQESIAQHCTQCTLVAEDIAHGLNISVRTLHRALAACGQTFGELLMAARVTLATRMLESPLMARLTIAEIGRRSGFADPSHFARVFRRHTGMTPVHARVGRVTPALVRDQNRCHGSAGEFGAGKQNEGEWTKADG